MPRVRAPTLAMISRLCAGRTRCRARGQPYARLIAEYSTAHGAATNVAANGYVYPPLLAVLLAVPLRLGTGRRPAIGCSGISS